MLQDRRVGGALAAIVLVALISIAGESEAAEKLIGTSCSTDTNNVDFDTIGQCVSGTFTRAPLFLGAVTNPPYAAIVCDGTKAGALQWTGSVFQACDGSNWATFGGAVTAFLGTATSAANPQISGDATSGFYTPAASTVAVTVGGVEAMQWNTASSGVNFISVTPAATGNGPIVAAAGSDTNIALNVDTKGTGGINFVTGGGTQLQITNTASAVDNISITGSTTSAKVPTISAVGSDANISIYVAPKGTGGLTAGCNNNTASNTSTVLGCSSTASGNFSFASGQSVFATGADSVAVGSNAVASGVASFAMGGGAFSTTASGAQSVAWPGGTASGILSMAIGLTTAAAYNSLTIGANNVGGGTAGSWVATDPLFEVGNGADGSHLADALIVLKNGKVGIGAAAPTNALSFTGQSAQTIWMERETTAATAGNNLTVQAGGAKSGGTNLAGGNLVLSSGTATGTGSSSVVFQTATAGSTGTTDQSPATTMTLTGAGALNIATAAQGLQLNGNNAINYPSGDSTAGGSIAIGVSALANETAAGSAAYSNTAVGYQAVGTGTLTTAAKNITALGYQALKILTSGSDNTAIGTSALAANTSASSNTAVGTTAMLSITTGNGNTAVGYQALKTTTTGTSNTAVGFQAMHSATASSSVGIGSNALSGGCSPNPVNNTAVGPSAMGSTCGTTNGDTALGSGALLNLNGSNNVSVG